MQSEASSSPRILANVSLRHLNTFGVEAQARHFVEIRSTTDFRALHAEALYRRQPRFVLGGGSNVLFTGDFAGLVIKNSIPGIAVLREDDDHVWVRAGAGEVWHDLVLWSVARGLGGLENLSLIPGQVGAAPMQNIGAYGVEMESTCESVEAMVLDTGDPVTFLHRDCEFGYRDSMFKHGGRDRFLVTAVTVRLNKHPRFETSYGDLRKTLEEMGVQDPSVRAVSDAVIRIRSSKLPDPRAIGNAGSFFENPILPRSGAEALLASHPEMPHYPQPDGTVKLPAAWLIERCGWKGRRVGAAGVHDRHALVLVNHGGATGGQIHRLAMEIQASVRERFGIVLKPEVNLV
jgi:UDP-N-acetylmuramate dehydrogenase